MKHFSNQSNGSHVGRMNYGGAKFCRFALLPLMLLMLLLLPGRMVAQTDYDESVTFTALAGNPEDNTNETYANLFDGKKTKDKFCSDANATQEVCYASLSAQPYVVFEEGTGTLTFRYDTYKPEGAYDLNVGKNKPKWSSLFDKIKKVVFDASFANARPKSCYWWFGECYKLKAIEGIEYLNTENVTDMSSMFQSCSHSYPLDLTSFNTANVTDMSSMFKYCDITSLDLTSFNTANVTDMSSMFEHCRNLKSIFVSDKFVTGQITNGDNMFNDCENLRGYNDSKIDHNYANCSKTGYLDPGFGYAMFDNATETLTFSYKGFKSVTEYYYVLFEGRAKPEWYSKKDKIKKVVFDASFANARPKSCYWWFGECLNLTRIEGMENLNTEMVTTMAGMFYQCEALTSLDVTNFNTAKVTDMSLMFSSCTKLSSLNLYNFNTENVTNMLAMFSSCKNLATIYTSEKFVTTKVDNLNHFMFDDDEQLKGANAYDEMKTRVHCANYKTGYFTKLVGKNGDEKIGATGETLATDNLALDDDKDFVAYEPFAAKAASYSRTMKEGTTWATLCLPFDVSLADKNFRAFKLLSADDVTETVELEEIEGSIEAGTPVIIKMNDGATKLNFTEANKEIAKDVQTAETANGNYQLQGIYTKKVFSKDTDNSCYIVKGDKLMNPAKLLGETATESVGSKPFRAYMVDNSSAPAAGARMFSISVGGSTTAIEQLETTADSKAEYYDLQGRRLQNLQKGINIVKRGGKTMKVIIK